MKMARVSAALILILLTHANTLDILTYRIPSSFVTVGEQVSFHCQYNVTSTEHVIIISWGKQNSTSQFENIATFFPPGPSQNGSTLVQTPSGQSFKNRSHLINPSHGSLDAIFSVTKTKCEDQGLYRCYILTAGNNGQTMEIGVVSLSIFVPADKVYTFTTASNMIELEEGDNLAFSCVTNRGEPPGKVRLGLKRPGDTEYDEIMAISSDLTEQVGVCNYTTNSSFSYLLTKKDNAAVFRCTITQNLTASEHSEDSPYKEIGPINVYYKVREPKIVKEPDADVYAVGTDAVVLTCMVDGNPKPANSSDGNTNKLLWYYRNSTNGTSVLASTIPGVSVSNNKLRLISLTTDQQGIYTCLVQNGFKRRIYKEKQDIRISIGIPTAILPPTSSTQKEISESLKTVDTKKTSVSYPELFGGLVGGSIIAAVIGIIVYRRKIRNERSRQKYTPKEDDTKEENTTPKRQISPTASITSQDVRSKQKYTPKENDTKEENTTPKRQISPTASITSQKVSSFNSLAEECYLEPREITSHSSVKTFDSEPTAHYMAMQLNATDPATKKRDSMQGEGVYEPITCKNAPPTADGPV